MSTADQVPESSMEEILASIRKIISEGEAKGEQAQPGAPAADLATPDFATADNASRRFETTPAASSVVEQHETEPSSSPASPPSSSAVAPATNRHPLSRPADAVTVRTPAAEGSDAPESLTQGPSGRSALPGHAVAAGKADDRPDDDGPTKARSVEQIAEDLLRTMLSDWLDKNLPALVERLIREEIARVIRNRTDV
jgi:cell pole-organizing protein PopZ